MKELIAGFADHLKEALAIGRQAQLKATEKKYRQILIAGLGGSGIGGTIISDLLTEKAPVPIGVCKDYHIPAYVNEETLFIVSSYSGNTEETVSTLKQAQKKGAEIAVVTSGGVLLEIAREHQFNHIVIPGGQPPRGMFAYSFPQLYFLLQHYGIITNDFQQEIEHAIALIEHEENTLTEEAKALAEQLFEKRPVIYSAAKYEGVAVRFRQQLNENAKMLAWHHVIPEMNHNELVGWKDGNEKIAVVFFRNDTDFDRIQKRMEINKEIMLRHTPHIIEVWSKGASPLEKTLYLIHLGDWTSLFLSEMNKVDVVEVKVIDYLKGELAKL